jgi:hypothetical protein
LRNIQARKPFPLHGNETRVSDLIDVGSDREHGGRTSPAGRDDPAGPDGATIA